MATYERPVFLNHLISRSRTRAPQDIKAPTHSARELLEIIDARRRKGQGVEFLTARDQDADPEDASLKDEIEAASFIRVSHLQWLKSEHHDYVVMLVEQVDGSVNSFAVVHRQTLAGRELSGEEEERGATAAHVVVRLPKTENADLGEYRVAIEVVTGLPRKNIERLFVWQLRRHVDRGWEFIVEGRSKAGEIARKNYLYTPRLELHADIGRSISTSPAGTILSQLIFTKRSEAQSVGKPTDVDHEDIVADVEIRVSAKQAPVEVQGKRSWVARIRSYYESQGYTSKLYFRRPSGATLSGAVGSDEASAADLLLCPKEVVTFDGEPKKWRAELSPHVADKLLELVNRDALWKPAK